MIVAKHWQNHVPCRLQGFFGSDLHKDKQRSHQDDGKILGAFRYDVFRIRHDTHERMGEEKSDQKKDAPVDEGHSVTVAGHKVGFFETPGAQPA